MLEWVIVHFLFWQMRGQVRAFWFGLVVGLALAWAPRLVMWIRLSLGGR